MSRSAPAEILILIGDDLRDAFSHQPNQKVVLLHARSQQHALQRCFDAILAASDLIAIGAMRALQAAGKRIPEDVAVIGFDDIPAAGLASPPLTTVMQDARLAGRTLVEMIEFQRLFDEQTAPDLQIHPIADNCCIQRHDQVCHCGVRQGTAAWRETRRCGRPEPPGGYAWIGQSMNSWVYVQQPDAYMGNNPSFNNSDPDRAVILNTNGIIDQTALSLSISGAAAKQGPSRAPMVRKCSDERCASVAASSS